MNKIILFISCLVFSLSFLKAQDSIPKASAAYLFDEESWTGPTIEDISDNGYDAYWYSYWVETGEEERPRWAGYREGKFGNSMKMNGFHDWGCTSEEPCPKEDQFFHTSSLDFVVFSGNEGHEKQIVDGSPLFLEPWDSSFTIAYWYKSIRDYNKTEKPYPSDDTADIGMGEVEYHVSFGDGNQGVVIRNYRGLLNVNIKGEDDAGTIHEVKFVEIVNRNTWSVANQEWQHVAVTFDKSTGMVTAYLDGDVASEYVGFDASKETEIKKIDMGMNSCEFGTLNNANIVENLPPYWSEDPTGTEGLLPIDGNKLRAGWPYGGYLDELVIYKNHALDETQLEMLIDSGYVKAANVDTGGSGSSIQTFEKNNLHIYPNPSDGTIYLSGLEGIRGHCTLEVINLVGQVVYKTDFLNTGNKLNVTLPGDLNGVLSVRVISENASYTGKVILK